MENEPHHHPQNRFSIPASIVLGCLIIAASIFYNTKLIIKNFGFDAVNPKLAGTGSDIVQPAAPAAQPSAGQAIKLAERKDAAVLGKSSAKVLIVEFSDFQCPFCQKFFKETFASLKSKYLDTGKVRLVFRHFPLPFHVNAQKAAEASECASRQGKFWEYHNMLFENSQPDGTNFDVDSLKKYADSLGLNKGTLGFAVNKFNDCLNKGEAAAAVSQDAKDGQAVAVSGTPSFLIIKNNDLTLDVAYIRSQVQAQKSVISLPNGNIFFVGAQPMANFEQAIEQALKD